MIHFVHFRFCILAQHYKINNFYQQAFDEEMDTDDEDLDSRVAKMSDSLHRKAGLGGGVRRARSESPYAKCATVHPEDFISFQRKRSTSCGFNSDSSDVSPSGGRKYYTQVPSKI